MSKLLKIKINQKYSIISQNIERYNEIERRMKRGIRVKKFIQKKAMKYIKEL